MSEPTPRKQPMRALAWLTAATLSLSACGGSPPASDGTTTTLVPDPAEGATTGTIVRPEPPDPNPELLFEWVEASFSGVESIDQIIVTSDDFIAYRFDESPAAFTSPDGVEWTPRPIETDHFISGDVARGGSGYAALGSSGGTGEDDLLMTSSDGFAWSSLPLDLEAPELGVFSSYEIDGLAVSESAFVIKGILSRGEGGPDEHRFVTWASEDGSAWTLANDPFPPGLFVHDVVGVGDGFLAQDSNGGVFASQDGLSWSQMDTPWDEAWFAQPELVWRDGNLFQVASDTGVLWMVDDDFGVSESWDLGTLPGSEEYDVWVETVSAGPLGIVLAGHLATPQYEGPPPDIVISKEGVEVTTGVGEETFFLTVIDEGTGAVLVDVEWGGDEWDEVVVEQDDGISILDPETLDEIVFISHKESDAARKKAFADLGYPDPADEWQEPVRVLWFSPDGVEWTIIDLTETFGIEDWSEVVVGRDALILRWSGWQLGVPEDAEPEEVPPDVIWVGRLVSP